MNTVQIFKVLLSDIYVRRASIVRVLAHDQLPNHIALTKTAAFVVNTDPSDQPGSHWVALYYNGLGQFEYFDSFGLPVLHGDILSFVERNSNKPLVYNTRTLQDVLSNTCALYAIYFLLIKVRGGTMRRVLLPFGAGHRQRINDRIIYRLVKPWLVKTSLDLSFRK
jgi:hypothetical protein